MAPVDRQPPWYETESWFHSRGPLPNSNEHFQGVCQGREANRHPVLASCWPGPGSSTDPEQRIKHCQTKVIKPSDKRRKPPKRIKNTCLHVLGVISCFINAMCNFFYFKRALRVQIFTGQITGVYISLRQT